MRIHLSKIILTHHAQQRLSQRRISSQTITAAIENPDKRFEQQEPQGSIKFIKNFGDRVLHVVATYLPEEKKWLIISGWIRGEEDAPSFEQELVLSPFKLIWAIGKLIWKMIRSSR